MPMTTNQARRVLRNRMQEKIGPFGSVRVFPDTDSNRVRFKVVCHLCAHEPGKRHWKRVAEAMDSTLKVWHEHLRDEHPDRTS